MTFIPVTETESSPPNVFIYRDSEPNPTGNVFATWAATMAARQAFCSEKGTGATFVSSFEIQGLDGVPSSAVDTFITITGSSVPGCNGTWQITGYVGPGDFYVYAPGASADTGSDSWFWGQFPATVLVDDILNIGGAATTAGPYNFEQTELRGIIHAQHTIGGAGAAVSSGMAVLDVVDGTKLNYLRVVRDLAILSNDNNTPIWPYQYAPEGEDQLVLDNAILYPNGNYALIEMNGDFAGNELAIVLMNGSHFVSGDEPVLNIVAFQVSITIIGAYGNDESCDGLRVSEVEESTITSDAESSIFITYDSVGVYNTTQSGLLGTVTKTSLSRGGGGGGNVFVYRDSEPSPTGNVYATFDAAYTARAALAGSAIIEVDDSLHTCSVQTPISEIPYDMADTILQGLPQEMTGSHTPLVSQITWTGEGEIFTHLREIKNLNIVVNNVSTSMRLGGDDEEEADWLVLDHVNVNVTSTGYFADASDVDEYTVYMRNGSTVTSSDREAFNYGETELIFYMFDNSSLGSGTVAGAIGEVIFNLDPTSVVNLPQPNSIGSNRGSILGGGSATYNDTDVTLQTLQATTVVIVTGLTAARNLTLVPNPLQDQEVTVISGDATMDSFSFTILGTINQTTNYVMSGAGSTATIRYNFTTGWQLV
jgi:hypothetical protein